MVNQLRKELIEVIETIKTSSDYLACIKLKDEMSKNSNLMELISKVKKLQKEYVKTNDDNLKKELDECQERLEQNPLYVTYINHLEKVNSMISYVEDDLNQFFLELTN